MSLPNSMTPRLVLTLLLAALLFGGFAGYASYRSALHENDEIFDAQLAQVAQTLPAIGAFAGSANPNVRWTWSLRGAIRRGTSWRAKSSGTMSNRSSPGFRCLPW